MTNNKTSWRACRYGGPLTHAFFDYGDTLTHSRDDVDPKLGMRPISDDALLTIWELHTVGVTVGLVSNTRPGQDRRQALQAAGVADLFADRVFLSHELSVTKHRPRFFRRVLDDLGIRPDQALVCGNRFETDVRVPASLGIRAVLLGPASARAELPKRATLITTIRDLPSILTGGDPGVRLGPDQHPRRNEGP